MSCTYRSLIQPSTCIHLQHNPEQKPRKKRLNHSIIPRVLAYKEFTGNSVKFTRRRGIEQDLLDIADAENDVRKLSLNSNAVRTNGVNASTIAFSLSCEVILVVSCHLPAPILSHPLLSRTTACRLFLSPIVQMHGRAHRTTSLEWGGGTRACTS